MKLLGSNKSEIAKDKNCENMPNSEITEVVLVYYNIDNNDYQHDLRVLYTFIPSKLFSQLLDISPETFIILKTAYIALWFTDQTSKPIEIENNLSITLVIN